MEDHDVTNYFLYNSCNEILNYAYIFKFKSKRSTFWFNLSFIIYIYICNVTSVDYEHQEMFY